MEIVYSVQFNNRTKRCIVIQRILFKDEIELKPNKDCEIITWLNSRTKAIAIKEFLNSYIYIQKEDIFNWKPTGNKIYNLFENLEYCIKYYNS